MWDRITLERELAQLGVRESADLHGLREYQGEPIDVPVQQIAFEAWRHSLNVHFVKMTAAAAPDHVTIQGSEKINPLAFDRPIRMWIRAGDHARHRRGQVVINLAIEYEGIGKVPYSSKVARARFDTKLPLKFLCTAEGGIWLDRGSPPRRTVPRGDDLGVEVEVYQRKDKPKNNAMRGIPTSVWDEWMKTFSILRIVIIVKLTVTKPGEGSLTVDIKHPSVPIPDPIKAGSTGPRTGRLGPMTIDLVPEEARPTLTTKQGVFLNVHFGKDSDELDKIVDEGPDGRIHQGNKLDAWIRDSLVARWDVREALLRGDLPVRGEARASATLKGKSRDQLLQYNQTLSEKRRDTVVNRLKTTITRLDRDIRLDTTQIKIGAVGASKAPKFGEETVNERRCELRIDPADLDAAIKKVYKVHRWWWDR